MVDAYSKTMAKVIAKAWTDPAYKKRLLKEPAKVVAAEGIKIPKGTKVHIHENSKKAMHIVLPARPDAALTADALNQMAGAQGVLSHLYTCAAK
jgi:hypothetical protein